MLRRHCRPHARCAPAAAITLGIADSTNITVDGRGTASYSEFDTLQTSRGRITGAIGDGSGGRLEAHTGGGAIRIVR
jgi:hypothetical protein